MAVGSVEGGAVAGGSLERAAGWMGSRGGLLVADGFVALTAVGGGVALATGLEGERFPLEMLHGTPFTSYVVPGLLLALVVGGSATAASLATIRSPMLGGIASVAAGAIMVGWIGGEALILDQPDAPTPTELLYAAVGGAMMLLGVRVWRAFRRG
jgi:hypothetical protein